MRKARSWRGISHRGKKILRKQAGWLATQCCSHPSPAKFPANREFFRELSRFGTPETPILAQKRYIYGVSAQIPYSGLQGILVG
jgi:hypothetical protein